MLNNKKSPIRKLAKYLSVLTLALLLITANSVYAQTNETQQETPPQEAVKKEGKRDKVFMEVDKQPEFPGGTTGLKKWLRANIKHQVNLHGKKIQGSVIVNFIVEKDGAVSNVKVDRGMDLLLMKEASRVVSLMPKWKPGELNNEAVRVKNTLQVDFLFSKEDYYIKCLSQKPEKEEDNEVTVRGFGAMGDTTSKSLAEKYGDDKPLFIIDNVVMDNDFDLQSINPADIESIYVIKNESSMKIYGDKGKNGVVIIFTKSASKFKGIPDKKTDQSKNNRDDEIFVVVEVQPKFPGGMDGMMSYLSDNIKYPAEAHKKGIEERVITNFVVNKDGSVSDVVIVRGIDPLLDAEAVRVITLMPKWEPGMQKGKNVNVRFTLPVKFSIPTEEETLRESQRMKIAALDFQQSFQIKYEPQKTIPSINITNNKKMYVIDKLPEYPGGIRAMLSFLGENTLKISKHGFELQGRFITSFFINKDGSISDIKIERGHDKMLGREAIRIISEMPKWNPGIENGDTVRFKITLPVVFKSPN